MRWLKSLVGLRKVERQQRRRKEDGDAGRIVRGLYLYLPIGFRVTFFLFSYRGLISVFKFVDWNQ